MQRSLPKSLVWRSVRRCSLQVVLGLLCCFAVSAHGQSGSPLDEVHVEPPPAKTAPAPAAPNTLNGEKMVEGPAALHAHAHESIRVDVNLTLIPLTVTDPMNRLVTGLEKNNFYLYEKGTTGPEQLQTVKTFSTEDAPVTIGIILDLSGSMAGKFNRSRQALKAFLKTANPKDEFFVIGFNDRPDLMEDFTSSVDDIDTRLALAKPQKRTALLDAIYFGVNKMKDAAYQRKALLIVSDGGDNRSRYSENEVRAIVRESDVQIFAMGVFDTYAPTEEERLGPMLLSDLCEDTGGQMFRVDEISDMTDVAEKISDQIREEYVLGYRSNDPRNDGKWRKVKVRLDPPSGLPMLTVHARSGYYAPSQ
jgi:Ca-activated chloride channel family protein